MDKLEKGGQPPDSTKGQELTGITPQDQKPSLGATEENRTSFAVVTEVHNQLLRRFGRYNTSNWQPTENNVRILDDEAFDQEVGKYIEQEIGDGEAAKEHVRMITGYAHFGTQQLYAMASQGVGQLTRQILAHEMLHLWFMRSHTDEGNAYSYGVNETLVDTLALEGLNLFKIPKHERESEIDGMINNSIVIKEVIDKVGEKGWEAIFRVCQTGDQTKIAALTEKSFGLPPPEELSEINEALPVLFGKSFWSRLKEFALMIYFVRQDPNFSINNPAVFYQTSLIAEWAGIGSRYLQEIDIHWQ